WLRSLTSKWFPSRSPRRGAPRRRRRSASLELEPLEERYVPARIFWTGALMADPDTTKTGPNLDGDNRWSARGVRTINNVQVTPTNWKDESGNTNVLPGNGDDIVFPVLPTANKVGQALTEDVNGNSRVSNYLVNGQGPRNDLFDVSLSRNTLKS